MANLAFAAIQILIFEGIIISSTAAAHPISTSFQVWLANFDQTKALATRSTNCVGKPDGFYPNEPDTCSNSYVACVAGNEYPQYCRADWVFDAEVLKCVDRAYAISAACYPPPYCDDTNEGVFMPTEYCGDLYYICIQGEIFFQKCDPGEIFDLVTLTCIDNTGPNSCTKPTTTSSTTSTTGRTTTTLTSTEATTISSPTSTEASATSTTTSSTETTTRPILPTAPCTDCAKIMF